MPQIHQVPSDADDQLETGNGTARQHVPAGVCVHQRVPVRVMSAARVRTAVPVDDPTVHRLGRAEVRHDQSLLPAHEVRSTFPPSPIQPPTPTVDRRAVAFSFLRSLSVLNF